MALVNYRRLVLIDLIKKYKWIMAVILFAILLIILLISFNSTSKNIYLLDNVGVDKIISMDNNFYYLSGKSVNKSSISKIPSDESIFIEDVSYIDSSQQNNKFYYNTGTGKAQKSFIYDVDSNKSTEFINYNGYFWDKNEIKLIKTSKNKSNIYNDEGELKYSNQPYVKFISLDGLILGDVKNTNGGDTIGFRWKSINPSNNEIKEIIINDTKEDNYPIITGERMLYANNNEQVVIIDKYGNKKISKENININSITLGSNKEQFFMDISGGKISIKSIDLETLKTNVRRSINIADIQKNTGLNITAYKQVFYTNNIFYVLVNNQVVAIEL
jgi:hypothetical protein